MGFTPRLERLAIRLANPARFFAGLANHDWAKPYGAAQVPPADDAGQSSDVAPVTDLEPAMPSCLRIAVPLFRAPPQAVAMAQVVGVHKAMADAGKWPDLFAALRAADQSRVTMEGGKRVVELVSEGARATLAAAIARKDFAAARTEVGRIAAAHAAHRQDYGAAHLLAQAHLDLGWGLRGAALGGAVDGVASRVTAATLAQGAKTVPGWQAYLDHVATAEAVLEDFDPIEQSSPLLAGTRYLLVRGLDDGAALYRDWYEDWVDLDPTNWTAHATHAPHLLPHWFGTRQGFDVEAQVAANRTGSDMGAAGYAMFYMAVAEGLGDMPSGLDLPLMVQGLRDFAAQTGCQYRANIVAGTLTELAHVLHLEGPEDAPQFALVHRALCDVVTGQLREFHLTAWDNGDDCIRWALGQVFGHKLTPGARVVVGDTGLAVAAA